MKICIFFDGQNFYRSLLRYDESLRVDYDRLALWITQKVGGDGAVFGGAYYYVGVSSGAPQQVEAFLKGLELRPGYFVKRDPRVRRTGRCPNCGSEYEYTTEKRVDTRLVADLIHYAAHGAYDAAVLISGDDDFVPAVEAVNALGKQVWVATWSAEELSTDLRVRCFGQIRLSDGIAAFRVERPRLLDRERGVPPRGPRPAGVVPAALSGSAPSLARTTRASCRQTPAWLRNGRRVSSQTRTTSLSTRRLTTRAWSTPISRARAAAAASSPPAPRASTERTSRTRMARASSASSSALS